MTDGLKNPMRFSIRNRCISIEEKLRHRDFDEKRVTRIEILGEQMYVHWERLDGTEQSETIEVDRQRAATMLHQLTLTRERECLSPVSDEHVDTATTWLEESLREASDEGS